MPDETLHHNCMHDNQGERGEILPLPRKRCIVCVEEVSAAFAVPCCPDEPVVEGLHERTNAH